MAQTLNELDSFFYFMKMAQKFFYDILGPITTYTEGPSDFKKIVIALLSSGGTYLVITICYTPTAKYTTNWPYITK